MQCFPYIDYTLAARQCMQMTHQCMLVWKILCPSMCGWNIHVIRCSETPFLQGFKVVLPIKCIGILNFKVKFPTFHKKDFSCFGKELKYKTNQMNDWEQDIKVLTHGDRQFNIPMYFGIFRLDSIRVWSIFMRLSQFYKVCQKKSDQDSFVSNTKMCW